MYQRHIGYARGYRNITPHPFYAILNPGRQFRYDLVQRRSFTCSHEHRHKPTSARLPNLAQANGATKAPSKLTRDKKPVVPEEQIAKNGDLLSESVVSTSQQRKADWAIIKEMSQYLWPKVGHSVLAIAKDRKILILCKEFYWYKSQSQSCARSSCGSKGMLIEFTMEYNLTISIGAQRANTILLQINRR